MNHGEALIIWKRNGLKLPELPLDECIFPNAERLLKNEAINTDLREACKHALWRDGYNGNYMWHKSRTMLQQAISKAEGDNHSQ